MGAADEGEWGGETLHAVKLSMHNGAPGDAPHGCAPAKPLVRKGLPTVLCQVGGLPDGLVRARVAAEHVAPQAADSGAAAERGAVQHREDRGEAHGVCQRHEGRVEVVVFICAD